jgi:hypothetical protein
MGVFASDVQRERSKNHAFEHLGNRFTSVPSAKPDVSMMPPEYPAVRFNVCVIIIPFAESDEVIATAREQQFGSSIVRDKPTGSVSGIGWAFAQDIAAGNCGKKIGLFSSSSASGKQSFLLFQDIAYRRDGNWTYSCP